MIDLKTLGGRYPLDNLARFEPQNIRATLDCQGDTVIIRVDDVNHIEAWQEYAIDVRAVLSELCRQRQCNMDERIQNKEAQATSGQAQLSEHVPVMDGVNSSR